jgi:hypothetical protein
MEFRLFVFGFELESRERLIVSQCSMGIALCFFTDTDHESRLRAIERHSGVQAQTRFSFALVAWFAR